jgi:hypothetical protein
MTEDLGPAKTFFAYMEAVLASDLKPNQRLVLLVQAKHADAHDGTLTNSFPSQETMVAETGLCKKTVHTVRKQLVELGWLDQTHSGRGGNSNLSNAYDLYIPGELIDRLDAEPKRNGYALQSVNQGGQSVNDDQAKRTSYATSTPSSTPPSAAISTPSGMAAKEESKEGRKDGPVSYWVGYSPNHPDGYFVRVDRAKNEPKGRRVLVTIPMADNINLWSGSGREEVLGHLLDLARPLGLEQPGSPYRRRNDPRLVVSAGSGGLASRAAARDPWHVR